jgi:hypothetical protein
MRHGGGEVGALSRRCWLLLGGAPATTSMKGLWRLRRRGPGMGVEAVAVAMMGSWLWKPTLQSLP